MLIEAMINENEIASVKRLPLTTPIGHGTDAKPVGPAEIRKGSDAGNAEADYVSVTNGPQQSIANLSCCEIGSTSCPERPRSGSVDTPMGCEFFQSGGLAGT